MHLHEINSLFNSACVYGTFSLCTDVWFCIHSVSLPYANKGSRSAGGVGRSLAMIMVGCHPAG